jgi:hypothetical protein
MSCRRAARACRGSRGSNTRLSSFSQGHLRVKRRRHAAHLVAFWSPTEQAWVVEPGEYRIRAAKSSRDLPEEESVVVGGAS